MATTLWSVFKQLILLLLVIENPTDGKRVIDRFLDSKYPSPSRCVFGIITQHTTEIPAFVDQQMLPFVHLAERMNCSAVRLPLQGVGQLTNGSYDGATGAVQRNEIDILLGLIRTDFFSIVAGHTTTQGPPADFLIISRRNDSNTKNYQLLELWTSSFDAITLTYVLLCLHLFLTVLMATENWQVIQSKSGAVAHLRKAWNRNLFKVFASFVDQENFDATTDSGMIIVWFFNLFLLFAVHGIMLGSMGADLVAEIDAPVINSLDEFTNTSYTQPVILTQFFLPPVLEKSTPGSELRHLKNMVEANPKENMLSVDFTDMTFMLKGIQHLIEQINNGRKALLIPKETFKSIQTVACEVVPHMAKHMGRSKQLFAPGIFIVLMSLKIDPDLRLVFNYVFGTLIETGQYKGLLHVMPSIMMPMMNQAYNGRSCDKEPREGHDVSAFDAGTFGPILRGYAILLLLSVFVLLMEQNCGISRRAVRYLKTCSKTLLRGGRHVRRINLQRLLLPLRWASLSRAIKRSRRVRPLVVVVTRREYT